MAKIIEHRKFVFVCNNLNSNKTWEVLLYDNDDVEVKYGRIGKSLQSKLHAKAGRKKLESLIHDKTRPSDHYDGGCYREIETLDVANDAASSTTTSKSQLKKLAVEQIATCPLTQKLISFFSEINAHNIYQATGGKIAYDTSAGTFRTPVGIVTRTNVDAARKLLDNIADFIQQHQFGKPFVTAMEDYLMLIPQDVGRKFDPRGFCGDIAGVQRQSSILDALEASIAAVISASGTKQTEVTPQLFHVKVQVEEDKKILGEIISFFNKGRKHGHVSYKLHLAVAYAVDMPAMQAAWDKDGSKLSNIWRLWHGTKASNCLSLLKQGFIIPPATASHVCGRAFGNGVYFSDASTKSLNYATPYWGGKDEGRYFMFYNWVAMGKYYKPTSTFSGGCEPGYDSTYEDGRVFQNSEMIVYRTSQILPTHLVEFAK